MKNAFHKKRWMSTFGCFCLLMVASVGMNPCDVTDGITAWRVYASEQEPDMASDPEGESITDAETQDGRNTSEAIPSESAENTENQPYVTPTPEEGVNQESEQEPAAGDSAETTVETSSGDAEKPEDTQEDSVTPAPTETPAPIPTATAMPTPTPAPTATPMPTPTPTPAAAKYTGFKTIDSKTYYYKEGVVVKGWLTLKGKKYFFNKKTGVMYTGWYNDSNGKKQYYFDPKTGVMKTGFYSDSKGNTWYLDTASGKVCYGWIKLSSGKYYANKKSGKLYKGWYTSADGKLFFDNAGKMAVGLQKVDAEHYCYFKSNGNMVTGAVVISGGTYYFDKKTGYRVTGLLTLKGKKYYLDPKNNGRMVTGWYGKLPNRYYFTKKGVMCCDVVGKIGTKYYGFAPNGKMYYNNLIYKDHKAILFNSKGEASYFKQGTKLDSGILKNLKDMGTFRVTYYCPCYSCSEGWGNGVSNRCGSPIHNKKGCEYAVLNHTIAVDPSVLPFGSAVYVNGIIYVAEDRGGGVIGKHIDIFVKDHTKAGNLFTSAEVYLLK